eukprot:gnl/MRDRNA2_/MRDRNA2_90106_c0_seq1.p1 gnl/MRDRNA2_/MRDRNA2_90106_c0~~gnl/MRDRNA2_/MRDRNA2_90106_c0_seq1.p1  ORF type:complete len:267 (+),score=93.89 gnl/MRDRNA2_/MRDRNA2_90106_c0_seq1:179-979(+)
MGDPAGEEVPELEEAQPLSDELLPDREKIFLELYAECDAEKAKALSKEARAQMEGAGANLTYAELDIATVHSILNLLKREYGPLYVGDGTFIDLGSGVGKAAVAAALLHPFKKVVGIECIDPLSKVASDVQGKFAAAAAPVMEAEKAPPELSFMTADFVAEITSQALAPVAAECKVAMAVATCYLEPQLKAMAAFAEMMPENSLFVTFGQQLPLSASSGEDWISLNVEQMEMTWGPSTVFIYKKQAPMVQDDVEEEEEKLPPKPAS